MLNIVLNESSGNVVPNYFKQEKGKVKSKGADTGICFRWGTFPFY